MGIINNLFNQTTIVTITPYVKDKGDPSWDVVGEGRVDVTDNIIVKELSKESIPIDPKNDPEVAKYPIERLALDPWRSVTPLALFLDGNDLQPGWYIQIGNRLPHGPPKSPIPHLYGNPYFSKRKAIYILEFYNPWKSINPSFTWDLAADCDYLWRLENFPCKLSDETFNVPVQHPAWYEVRIQKEQLKDLDGTVLEQQENCLWITLVFLPNIYLQLLTGVIPSILLAHQKVLGKYCSDEDCPPPKAEIDKLEEECPPGTCEVSCGGEVCCYDSQGNLVKSFVK